MKRTCHSIIPILGMTLSLAVVAAPVGDLVGPHATELGAVEGLVTFRGEIPKSQIADDSGMSRDSLEVDSKTRGLRFAVVYLMHENVGQPSSLTVDGTSVPREPGGRMPPEPADRMSAPHSPAAADKPLTVDQQNYAFTPHMIAVRAGEPVNFTSSDAANHNVRASSPNPTNEFNVFTGFGGKYEHRLVSDSQVRPVELSCDIHPWMRGWIYVFDHPAFAVTDAQGKFRIGSVAPGEYKLVAKQPDVRYKHEQTITITNGQTMKVEIEIRAEQLPQRKE